MSKFKVGDKVRVVTCSDHGKACDKPSHLQFFGKVCTVTNVESNGSHPYTLNENGACYWQDDELKLANEEKKMARRTFRLLKATPELKKGALVQEACDDGDQNYVSLGREYLTEQAAGDFDQYFNDGHIAFSRDTVEKQPNWFEEVEMHWVTKTVHTVKKVTKKKGKK